jgi:hypothetical protein
MSFFFEFFCLFINIYDEKVKLQPIEMKYTDGKYIIEYYGCKQHFLKFFNYLLRIQYYRFQILLKHSWW